MRYKPFYFFAAVALALFFMAPLAFAGTGFATTPLWLTPESPTDGQTVTLTALFRNAESNAISGTVLFYDGQVLISRKPITIPSNEVGTAVASFTITAGDHTFSATMSSINELSVSGGSTVVNIPTATVKLPEQFVAAKVNLTAQAAGDTTDTADQPILDQINTAEQGVLGAIPSPTKNKIATVAQAVDSWRASESSDLLAGAVAAKAAIAGQTTTATVDTNTVFGAKKINVQEPSASDNAVDGPLAYVELFFCTVFGYIFSTPVIFYLLGILLVYLILRFVVRRIARAFSKR